MSIFTKSISSLCVLLLPMSVFAKGPSIHRPEGKTLVPVDVKELLKEGPQDDWAQGIQVRTLGGNDRISTHIVWIKTQEKRHVHAKHDATVFLLKGHGTLWFAGQEVPMKEGDVVTITRGIAHAFKNEAKQPTAAYVVFSPPFDGKDVIEVHDVIR